MADQAEVATERIVRLALYAFRGQTFTIAEATSDIPGYTEDRDAAHDGSAADDVRKKFGRDLIELREKFGIDFEFIAEDNCYKVASQFFDGAERTALIAALAVVEVEGIAQDNAAMTKYAAAVDSSGRSVIIALHEHFLAIRSAMSEGHPIAFRYHGRDRVLEPWALGHWRNNWYVVGNDLTADSYRRYRLDRIESNDGAAIEVLSDSTYRPPADVGSRDHLRLDPNEWGSDPAVEALIDVHPDHVHRLLEDLGGTAVAADGNSYQGWPQFSLEVRDYESFRDRILRLGTHARVQGPPVLVSGITSWLEALEVGV